MAASSPAPHGREGRAGAFGVPAAEADAFAALGAFGVEAGALVALGAGGGASALLVALGEGAAFGVPGAGVSMEAAGALGDGPAHATNAPAPSAHTTPTKSPVRPDRALVIPRGYVLRPSRVPSARASFFARRTLVWILAEPRSRARLDGEGAASVPAMRYTVATPSEDGAP